VATRGRLTAKGAATRDRILSSAADLVLARGVGGTTLDDICAATATGKSQLFHYFPNGKNELVSAIAMFQGSRVLDAQRPFLDHLDSWASWEGWRAAVLAHYGAQPHWSCPVSALASELIGHDPDHAAAVASYMDRWQDHLINGVERMAAAGLLRDDADPTKLAVGVFAALHGGLLLMQTTRSLAPLEAALDTGLTALRAAARPTE
jgi:AcrR family transcriptional regulator